MDQNFFLGLLAAYLIGSVPFSQVIGRLVKGIDLRAVGTRNVGGTNLISTAGAGWGLLGGGLDAAKGAAALWMAQDVFKIPFPQFLIAGLAVVAGHCWSIWIGFKGGKGLATTSGVLAWVIWPFALVPAAIYALLHWRTRNGTTAAAGAFVAAFIYFIVASVPIQIILLLVGIVCLVLLASLHDLLHTARSADSWTENFVTSKKHYGKSPRDRKIRTRKVAKKPRSVDY